MPDGHAARIDAVLIHSSDEQVAECSRQLAKREGPIVGMVASRTGLRDLASLQIDRLYVERTLSVNTAAAGGNASLMTIG